MSELEEPLIARVRRSWVETLPDIPFDLDVPWRDTPADSLQALLFLLRLEKEIERPIPFDLFGPDTTPASLVGALEKIDHGPKHEQALQVVLVPGIYGDEPRLADFRRASGSALTFRTLSLPDLDAPFDVISSVRATAAWIAQTQLEPADESWQASPIVGYSFGGLIALEIATGSARTVPLLCLLDSWLHYEKTEPAIEEPMGEPRPPVESNISKLRQLAHRDGRRIFMTKRLIKTLLLFRAYRTVQTLYLRVKDTLPLREQVIQRRLVLGAIRGRAVKRWSPARYAGRTLLFSTPHMERYHSPEAWRAVCPDLEVVKVDGDHFSVLDPAQAHDLARRLSPAAL